jgi:catechol 2,3-dioxygenase-like lactoylglutathione lyase family enzyme
MPPAVTRILETSLYVANLGRSRDFYAALFGFPVLMEDQRMVAMALPAKQVLLLFRHGATAAPSEMPFGTVPAHGGVSQGAALHLCLAIAYDQLAPWEAHLHATGIAIESRITWPAGGTSLYFRDPDGHSIEVATPGLWRNDPLEPPIAARGA